MLAVFVILGLSILCVILGCLLINKHIKYGISRQNSVYLENELKLRTQILIDVLCIEIHNQTIHKGGVVLWENTFKILGRCLKSLHHLNTYFLNDTTIPEDTKAKLLDETSTTLNDTYPAASVIENALRLDDNPGSPHGGNWDDAVKHRQYLIRKLSWADSIYQEENNEVYKHEQFTEDE